MDKININIKNGGFPPLKYCKIEDTQIKSKDRGFNMVNIKQLIYNNNKNIISLKKDESLEIAIEL
jgi:hypothetical protein